MKGGGRSRWLFVLGAVVLSAIVPLVLLERAGEERPGPVRSSQPVADPPTPAPAEIAGAAPARVEAAALVPEEDSESPLASAPVGSASGLVLVEGVVLDLPVDGNECDGVPAEGVKVEIRYFVDGARWPGASTRTDAAGRFAAEIQTTRSLSHVLVVRCSPSSVLREASRAVPLEVGVERVTDVVLCRYPAGSLHGRTVDPAGAAIASVAVRLDARRGKELPVAVSDAAGRFAFDRRDARTSVRFHSAERVGYLLLDSPDPVPRPRGGFENAVLVLAPIAGLRVNVASAEGDPVADAELVLEVSGEQRYGRPIAPPKLVARTDAEGVARFEQVWARQRLAVGAARSRFDRVRADGSLSATEGVPLALRPGETHGVSITLPPRLKASGVVLDEQGAPVPYAMVTITPIDAARRPGAPDRFGARTDASGAFSIKPITDRVMGTALVHATSHRKFWVPLEGKVARRGWALVDFTGAQHGGVSDLVVVCRPVLSITGRVIADSVPVRANRPRLACLPVGLPLPPEFLVPRPFTPAGADGRFFIGGLLAADYDLHVTMPGRGETWLRSVPAGTRGLEIELGEQRAAQIDVRVSGPAGLPGRLTVVAARLHPRSAAVPDAPELPADARFDRPTGWPELPHDAKARTLWSERGRIVVEVWTGADATRPIELDPGWYWIGVRVSGAGGSSYPMGTGLVRIDAGKHTLAFELRRSVPLECRVEPFASDRALRATVRLRSGEVVALDTGGSKPEAEVALGSLGRLHTNVPEGALEIHVSTHVTKVEARVGMEPVVIELQ